MLRDHREHSARRTLTTRVPLGWRVRDVHVVVFGREHKRSFADARDAAEFFGAHEPPESGAGDEPHRAGRAVVAGAHDGGA